MTDKEWKEFLNQAKTCAQCGVTWNDCLESHDDSKCVTTGEIEDELFVVALKRMGGGIPSTAKILGTATGTKWDAAAFFLLREEAEEYATYANANYPLPSCPYGVYRALVRLEKMV